MSWIKNLVKKIRYRKVYKLVGTFARDDSGRWMINPETGKILLKTDDPKVIAKAKKESNDRYQSIIKVLREERTCKCGGDGMCPCEQGSKMRHPASNEGRLPAQQAAKLLADKKKTTRKKK